LRRLKTVGSAAEEDIQSAIIIVIAPINGCMVNGNGRQTGIDIGEAVAGVAPNLDAL
jgi:hypothetical protein